MRRTVEVTDRGVYETLGWRHFVLGRSPADTAHAHDLDYVIAVDAGRRRSLKPTSALTPFRIARSFDITYNRTQDASPTQLNAATKHGQLRDFVHAYWAMRDERLPVPLDDLVRRDRRILPTDFAAMSSCDLQDITTRGDQLNRVLLAHYLRDLC